MQIDALLEGETIIRKSSLRKQPSELKDEDYWLYKYLILSRRSTVMDSSKYRLSV